MNAPRYLDQLLETCGSRRFCVRGEANEPCAPLHTTKCRIREWSSHMWEAMGAAELRDAPVPWDALWAEQASPFHHHVCPWTLTDLEAFHSYLVKPGNKQGNNNNNNSGRRRVETKEVLRMVTSSSRDDDDVTDRPSDPRRGRARRQTRNDVTVKNRMTSSDIRGRARRQTRMDRPLALSDDEDWDPST